MKNFKRVISAVIALALSASTLVAVSASKFTDVDNTSYAEAIDVLTALDVVHGYEDGSFQPDGDITRAEAATMIVGALNMTKDAQAAAGTSKFTDVNEKASWATGYVNVGVAQGFINGMNDTTFAPQENVTYAQMCVMLTLITGYGEYAQAYGGYPTGYTTMAASAGINKGVALANDAKLKRGQVAQMLYNAVTAPVLGVKDYSLQGNTYAPQDGTKGDFKTILADKFEGYAVDIKISGTPNSTATTTQLDKGKVNFYLTKDAFTEENTTKVKKYDGTTATDSAVFSNAFADIDVEPYFNAEGSAIITKDDNGKWHLIYFNAAETDSKSYSAADFDSVKIDTTSGYTIFNFGTGVETKVKTADITGGTVKVYVNNKEITAPTTKTNWENLLKAAQGEIKFTKDTSGSFNGIYMDYYAIGQVTTTKYSNDVTTINFSRIGSSADTILGVSSSKITISDDEVADGNVEVTVIRNGEAATLSAIAEDDIIAVYAASYPTEIKNPKTIKILATDATDTGTLKEAGDDDYTFNGTVYKKTNGNTEITVSDVGEDFTAILDPFGNLYGKKDVVSSVKYALVIDYDGEYLKLLTKDGSQKTYEVDMASTTVLSTAAANLTIQDRVISYTLKKNKISSATKVTAQKSSTHGTNDYSAAAKKVGNILLSDDSYIIDATAPAADLFSTVGSRKKINVAKLSTYSSLTDKVSYTAFAWDRTSDNTDSFVIVTKAGSAIGAESRFAVGKSTIRPTSVDDETVYALTALYNGEEQVLNISDTAKVYDYTNACADDPTTVADETVDPVVTKMVAATSLQGKAFFFTTDSDNYVDNIYVVFNGMAPAAVDDTVGALGTAYTGVTFGTGTINVDSLVDASNWTSTLGSASEDVRLVYGLVSDVNASSVTFVDDTVSTYPVTGADYSADLGGKGVIDKTEIYRFNLASDVAKYSYNVSSTANKTEDKITEEGLTKSNFKNFEYVKDSSLIWTKAAGTAVPTVSGSSGSESIIKAPASDAWDENANYAFAMIVNEQVVAIYQVVK